MDEEKTKKKEEKEMKIYSVSLRTRYFKKTRKEEENLRRYDYEWTTTFFFSPVHYVVEK